MRALALESGPSGRPAYLRIADAVRAAIRGGQALAGEAIPSTRELASRFDCHRHTVMAALDELIAEGWLVARARRAYVVSRELPSTFFDPARLGQGPAGRPVHEWRIVRDAPERPPAPEGLRHSFQSGLADLRLFPYGELRSHLSEVLRRPPAGVLGYGDPRGHPAFIERLRVYLRRVRAVEARDVTVTHGSQEAIFLIAQALLGPSDRVGVEALGYQPAWEALRLSGARLEPLAIDGEGLVPEAFEAACRKRRLRLLYVTPLHQYPTTVTLPVARRLAIYDIAVRHGVPILEDDYDHEFHYRCQPLAPLASDDPAGIVLYVSTFSKVFYPSARLGYAVVPPGAAGPLARLRRITSRQSDSLLQAAVARWMETGGLERHMRRMRRTYEQRRDAMAALLERHRERHPGLEWMLPDGGMALWLRVPRVSGELARAALRRGVLVYPEESFRMTAGPGEHVRLGFANQTPHEIERGLELLMESLGDP